MDAKFFQIFIETLNDEISNFAKEKIMLRSQLIHSERNLKEAIDRIATLEASIEKTSRKKEKLVDSSSF